MANYYSQAHICQCFSRLETAKRNSIVTIAGSRRKTGQQFVGSVLTLATGLLQLGLRNGDVVAISALNRFCSFPTPKLVLSSSIPFLFPKIEKKKELWLSLVFVLSKLWLTDEQVWNFFVVFITTFSLILKNEERLLWKYKWNLLVYLKYKFFLTWIWCYFSDWYLEWLLAVAYIGGIVAPLNYRWVSMLAGKVILLLMYVMDT